MKKKFPLSSNETFETFETLHNKPVSQMTRRELLSTGLISFSASLSLPPLLAILSRAGVAQAQELNCPSGSTNGLCPLITLNLSGGAALAANFVPVDQAGQFLPSYSRMGLGSGANLPIERAFCNNVPFAGNNISGFLAGLKQSATPQCLSGAAFVGVCVRSQDDSQSNKFDLTGMAIKAGVRGSILPNLGKNNVNGTGNKNMAAFIAPPSPLIVNSFDDISGSLGVSGRLASLSEPQKAGLFKLIENLSTHQAQKLLGLSGGGLLNQLVRCASGDNTKLISSPTNTVDPLQNAALSTIWNINAQTNRSSQDFVFATMVHNSLNGNAATCNLEMGGYDYHNNTRTTGDQKDLEAGMVLGRILESCRATGKKAFVVVTTDGSVVSATSDSPATPWTSDRGTAGMIYMMGYNPVACPQTKGFQLGRFTTGQAADDQFLTGNQPELAAAAMFANYLSFNGKMPLLEQVIPRVFTASDLDQILMFS